jgi:hypothetical protein
VAQASRPGPVTAIAVLNMLFGTFGALSALCCTTILGGTFYLAHANSPELQRGLTALNRTFPLVKFIVVAEAIAMVVMPCLLIASGYGLIKMRPWARKFTIRVGAAMLILITLVTVFMILQGNAALLQWLDDVQKTQAEMAKRQNQAPPPAIAPPISDPAAMIPSTILYLCLESAYPAIMIWMMMLPRVRRAFAIANGDLPPESAEPEDYRDPGRDALDRGLDPPRRSDESKRDSDPDDTRFRARPDQ